MANVQTFQARTLVANNGTGKLNVFQARPLVAYNVPSAGVNVTSASLQVGIRRTANIEVSQARVLAAVRGRAENPKLKAWTFTLDTHQFYVLRLGDGKTLLFDLTTGQWSWWSSGTSERWRASTGFNWDSPGELAYLYGSNILVGDDTYGHVWFLDPEQGYDESPTIDGLNVSFPRAVTAQMVVDRRNTLPVYEVYLSASAGYPALTGSSVTLYYSDDVGNTYVSAGTLEPTDMAYTQEFAWRSLGIVREPGRLFRIEDDGAFARINGLDVAYGAAAAQ